MKHRVRHNQLGRNTNQNKALKRGLVSAIFEKGRIETTLAKAKFIVGEVDRVMTFAKKGDLNARREVIKILGSDHLLNQIFSVVAPKTGTRTSGFTRIIKTGPRFSDATDMAILELVDYQVEVVKPVAKEESKETKSNEKLVEKVKPVKVTKAKPQTTLRPKKVGNK